MRDIEMPEQEAELLRETYRSATTRVILEYGSGGSTAFAATLPGKFIISVESDRDWARDLQLELDAGPTLSPAILYHVDIGPTGSWGRPVDFSHWQRFHGYPLAVWKEPFFRHPDVVLIDGRFRPACLVATALNISRPVRVLFDDYAKRQTYHVVEEFIRPSTLVGRMAVFDLEPGLLDAGRIDTIMEAFSQATSEENAGYKRPA
jgi:hypothetical protein